METRLILFIVLFPVVAAISAKVAQEGGKGCAVLNCCTGKNSTCSTVGYREHGLRVLSRCYCDASCVKTRDCCEDFRAKCQPRHCLMSNWASWSRCTKDCGAGKQTRHRQIIQRPENGGKQCEAKVQTRVCMGHSCNTKRHARARSTPKHGQARLLPGYFSQWRRSPRYDARRDIRSNLFSDQSPKQSYCGRYRITKATVGCDALAWSSVLRSNKTICVLCEEAAMKPHLSFTCQGTGELHLPQSWSALWVHGCNGLMQLEGRSTASAFTEKCECDATVDKFIFV